MEGEPWPSETWMKTTVLAEGHVVRRGVCCQLLLFSLSLLPKARDCENARSGSVSIGNFRGWA